MAIVEHAAAPAIGHDRRAETLGERAHLVGRFERAATDEDHRQSAFASSAAARSIASSSSGGRGVGRER